VKKRRKPKEEEKRRKTPEKKTRKLATAFQQRVKLKRDGKMRGGGRKEGRGGGREKEPIIREKKEKGMIKPSGKQ